MNKFTLHCLLLDNIWTTEMTTGRDDFVIRCDEFIRQNVYGHITIYAMELIKHGKHTEDVFSYATGNHF